MIRTIVSLVLLGCVATEARAQAWLADKGEATVAVSVQNIFVKDHYLPNVRVDAGQIRSNTLLIDTSYSATRKLAIDFGVPYVASKYNGPYPHVPIPGGHFSYKFLDSGQYHGTVQDLRFGVRYSLLTGRTAVTPFVGSVVPSHDYTFYSHSAVGRRLRELAVGTYVARLLDPVLPGAFIQARYSYSFTQRVLDIGHNHSNADLEVGYFVTPSVRAFALGSAQVTHGGLDLTLDSFGDGIYTVDRDFHHDRIDRSNYLNVGLGGAVSLSDSLDLFGTFVKTVAARNGHAINRGITIGVAWTVRPRKVRAPRTQLAPGHRSVAQDQTPREGADRAARRLALCVCQKTKS